MSDTTGLQGFEEECLKWDAFQNGVGKLTIFRNERKKGIIQCYLVVCVFDQNALYFILATNTTSVTELQG